MSFNGWKKIKLVDATTKIGSGSTPKGGSTAYKQYGIPFIRSQNIYNCEFDPRGIVFIDHNQAKKLANVELEKDDILLNITGDSVARCTKIPKEYIGGRVNQHVSIIRTNPNKLNSDFLKYILVSPNMQEFMLSLARMGGTRAALTKGMIEDFEISLPEIQEQKAIANILSTLDEKIETNNEINKKLEEMAQAIFKQWFVDFEFPNEDGEPYKSSGGEMVESEMGMIPSGWKVVSFLDYIDVLSGGTPKTTVQDYWNGEIPFFTPKDSKNMYCINTEKSLTEMGLNKCNSKLYDVNTVFITARGTVGKISIAGLRMAMNQSCYALIGKNNINQYFVYFQGKKIADELRGRASGSVFDAIVVDTFKAIKILKPQDKQLEYFKSMMESIFSTILAKNFENQRLDYIRNLIIPKLMSEEIRVPLNS